MCAASSGTRAPSPGSEFSGYSANFGFHFLYVLTLGVEFRSYELDLVDGLRGIAELAWRTESLGVGRSPKPQLINSSESQIQPHFIAGAVFAKIERHSEPLRAGISEMRYLCFWRRWVNRSG